MTPCPNDDARLLVRAAKMRRAVQWAYDQIPVTIRQRAARATQSGQYDAIWPEPKPASVVRYLRWHAQWAAVRRQIDAARPLDLSLKKTKRLP